MEKPKFSFLTERTYELHHKIQGMLLVVDHVLLLLLVLAHFVKVLLLVILTLGHVVSRFIKGGGPFPVCLDVDPLPLLWSPPCGVGADCAF